MFQQNTQHSSTNVIETIEENQVEVPTTAEATTDLLPEDEWNLNLNHQQPAVEGGGRIQTSNAMINRNFEHAKQAVKKYNLMREQQRRRELNLPPVVLDQTPLDQREPPPEPEQPKYPDPEVYIPKEEKIFRQDVEFDDQQPEIVHHQSEPPSSEAPVQSHFPGIPRVTFEYSESEDESEGEEFVFFEFDADERPIPDRKTVRVSTKDWKRLSSNYINEKLSGMI